MTARSGWSGSAGHGLTRTYRLSLLSIIVVID
jgi:hypothetical protein